MNSTSKRSIVLLVAGLMAAAACDGSPTAPRGGTQPFPDVEPVGTGTTPSPDGPILLTERRMEGLAIGSRERRLETEPRRSSQQIWSRADVVTFADPGRVVGESHLKRGREVAFRFRAAGLAPGHAATLWAVVFNNPEACVGECDDPDLFENPATMPDLMYVGGDVASRSGSIRYMGRIEVDDTRASIMPLFGLPAWGVRDAEKSEIHFVVRSHGELIAGLEEAQTTTFNGGCTGFGAEFGTPGPNECVDLYYASHLIG